MNIWVCTFCCEPYKYCHNTYGVVLHIDLPFLGLHDYDDYAEDCGLDVKSIIERYK